MKVLLLTCNPIYDWEYVSGEIWRLLTVRGIEMDKDGKWRTNQKFIADLDKRDLWNACLKVIEIPKNVRWKIVDGDDDDDGYRDDYYTRETIEIYKNGRWRRYY